MNKLTETYHCISGVNAPLNIEDASPAQLAYLVLNGSYGESIVARMLLDMAHVKGETPHVSPTNPNADVVQSYPKGRWT